MAETRNFPLFAILLVIAIIACAFIVFVLVGIIFHVSTNDNGQDIRNWVSLTIESAIGIFIAMMVLYYDKLQQKKNEKQQQDIENLAKDIKKIEEQQHSLLKSEHERIRRWKREWGTLILSNLDSIKRMYEILETWLNDYKKNPSNQLKADIIRTASMNGNSVESYIQNIRRYLPEIKSYFDEPTLGLNLTGIFEQLSVLFQTLHMDYHWESKDLESTFRMIAERKGILEDLIERVKKEIPE